MRAGTGSRGFTLKELLIVAALLLVILGALCYPVIGYARPAARSTLCKSNLKQLATAAAMYTSDFDGRYPPTGLHCADPAQPDGAPGCPSGALVRDTSRFGYSETWQGGGLKVLLPYTKSPGVLWCPAALRGEIVPTATDPKSYYAGFEWLERPARIRYPEAKVLLLEAYSYHETQDHKYEVRNPKRHDAAGNPQRRVNVAFADGHVKWMDLSTGCSGNPSPACAGWESCMGPGGNGNYVCSGFGKGVKVRDFPPRL